MHGFPYVDAHGRLPDWLDRYQSRYLTASQARTAWENSQLIRRLPGDITDHMRDIRDKRNRALN